MKKKLVVLMSVCVMSTMLVTACGAKDTAAKAEETKQETSVSEEVSSEVVESVVETETETTAETETTTETTEAGAEAAAGEWSVSEKYDPYLEWTGKEWAAASDDDKLLASIAYTAYVSAATGVSSAEDMVAALEDPSAASQLQTVVDTLEGMMGMAEVKDMTIKEVADLGLSQMQ